jgi:hypothetical protein
MWRSHGTLRALCSPSGETSFTEIPLSSDTNEALGALPPEPQRKSSRILLSDKT